MRRLLVLFVGISLCAADDSEQEFIKANNLFAQCAYDKLSKIETGNFLVSSFSAETILALTHFGANGETAEELRNVLHLPNDTSKIESSVKSLLPKLKENNLYIFHLANKLYVKENFEIKNEFKNVASQVFQAESESIDFTQAEASKTMNSWVEEQTENKIKNLVKPQDLDQDTRLILINALYFQANWTHLFLLPATQEADFYKTPSDVVKVPTMSHISKVFNYYECPHLKAQFLELPFKKSDASMTIVLPFEKDGLSSLEQQLDQVFASQHELERKPVNVFLPKFKIESEIDFKKILQSLGVNKAFTPEADLSGIAGQKGALYVSKVVQKAFIDVSEQGVEAAAATFVEVVNRVMLRPDFAKNFKADHPFIFFIKVKDVIVFVGRVTDPSES